MSSLVAALTVGVPLLACVALWAYARAGSDDAGFAAATEGRSLTVRLAARWPLLAAVDVVAAAGLVLLDAGAAGRMVRLGAPFVLFFALWAVVVRRAAAAAAAPPDPMAASTTRSRDDSRRAALLPIVGVIAAVLVLRALLSR